MRRSILVASVTAASLLTSSLARAQDYTGNVNPSAYSGPMVMQGAINAQARRDSARRSHRGVTRAQTNGCAQKARFRSRYGADNPKVQRLYALCHAIGL